MAVVKLSSVMEKAAPSDNRLGEIVQKQRAAFMRDGSPSAAQRIENINKVHRQMMKYQDEICEAISTDFGNRSHHESLMAEIFVTINSIKHCRSHVKKWMKPRRAPISWQFKPARGKIFYQPLGVVGIISPWNYPLQLAIVPVVQALAAGNRVLLKPSELTPNCSDLMAKMFSEVFSEEEVSVVTGGPEIGEAFSKLPFDHLFYTGSTKVGRYIMKAAAENLIPVTLELGGKSPCIIGKECPTDKAIASIVSGKLLNAGQTCVAPDYAFIPEDSVDDFIQGFKKQAEHMYSSIADNADYTSIVSQGHFERITRLVDDARAKGARVIELNPKEESLTDCRKIAPTLVLDVTDDMDIMQEEIFGPVLPVKTYNDLSEVIQYVNDHPRPLALYYFGNDGAAINNVLNNTTSGGACINETVFHVAQEELPFGGIGPSGTGSYHGYVGFKRLSHEKSVFFQSRFNTLGLFRPPYGKVFNTMVGFLIGKAPGQKAPVPRQEPESTPPENE